MFLGKGVLKICRKFTGEHPCRSVISIKLESNFIEIALRHGCSAVSVLHIFRIPFPKNTSGALLLTYYCLISEKLSEAAEVLYKKDVLKVCKIHRKTPLPKSLF